MYKVDQTTLSKLRNNIQTPAADCNPELTTYVVRNRTAVTSQRFWEKSLITPYAGTRTSIAVRRPDGCKLPDRIYMAQVYDSVATIWYADTKISLGDMEFERLTQIPNVKELSIVFDGVMEIENDLVEFYTTGLLPYVIYVNTSNQLKFLSLDNNTISGDISDDAVNVASVRGLYSGAADLDDGIWVFYTNAAGQLWEARILDGEVSELTQITLLPSGVTAWSDCWAGLSFDYRVILQLKGDDGKVYTLVSKSRPSGFSMLEYLALTKVKVSGQWGAEPPSLLQIDTVEVEE